MRNLRISAIVCESIDRLPFRSFDWVIPRIDQYAGFDGDEIDLRIWAEPISADPSVGIMSDCVEILLCIEIMNRRQNRWESLPEALVAELIGGHDSDSYNRRLRYAEQIEKTR